ncbi:MAG: hypothetical protein A2293_05450 [Elusimicrobia bacterium RIFOXYB2_FULL_49_7]|nr:MAG: hypothetical protein A2293_05450 [Elusimicrobia bacterium RIFOXYB2_FULL_49_7]
MKQGFVFLFAALLAGMVYAEIIVSDDFSTDGGFWNPLFSASYDLSGGKMTLSCTEATGYTWAVRVGLSQADFTFSVTTEMSNAGTNARAGISFRTQDNLDGYQFYVYPGGYYIATKMVGNVPENFFNNRLQGNSFISPTVNRLKVVVRSDTLTFFCNDQRLCELVDASVTGAGTVGLVVSGVVTVAFDDVVVEDGVSGTDGLSFFEDDFSDDDLFGWKNYAGLGTFELSGEKLRLTTPVSSNFAVLVSDGNYGTGDTVSVSTSKISGSGNNIYGPLFHASFDTAGGTQSLQGYAFCIVNGSSYSVLKFLRTGVTTLFAPVLSTSILPANNQFKVISHANGNMDLYINSTLLRTCTDSDANKFASGSVGVIGNGNDAAALVMDFDDFSVSSQGFVPVEVSKSRGLVSTLVPSLSASPNPACGAFRLGLQNPAAAVMTLSIHDVTGRVVHSMTFGKGVRLVNYDWMADNLPTGLYVAKVTAAGRSAVTRLALVR